MNKQEIAFFDFDGTITTRDSFLLFMQKTRGSQLYLTSLRLAPQAGLTLLGKYSREKLKTQFLDALFTGISKEAFTMLCTDFQQHHASTIIRPQAVRKIEEHKKNGTVVIVVTASPRLLVQPFCQQHGINCIGTELEFDEDGKFTGRLASPNCRKEEKVRRIKQHIDINQFDTIFVYGDSDGDYEMFQLASPEKRYYKPFRTKE